MPAALSLLAGEAPGSATLPATEERPMRKPISTKTHAILDYLTVGNLLVVPRLLGCSERITNALTAAALVKLAYTLMTNHEGGVVKVLPMKAHLAMDAVGGASLCALPYMVDDAEPRDQVVCCAFGSMELLTAPLTQTEPAPDSRMSIRQQIAPMSAEDYRKTPNAREQERSIAAWS
jgi:hypothetical protein